MILSRQQAGQLSGNEYKLQDTNGEIYKCDGLLGENLCIVSSHNTSRFVPLKNIFPEFKILCKPWSDITNQIDGIGIPLIELANISFPNRDWEMREHKNLTNKFAVSNPFWFKITQNGSDFSAVKNDGINSEYIIIPKQDQLFDKLKEWHFPVGLPEEFIIFKK